MQRALRGPVQGLSGVGVDEVADATGLEGAGRLEVFEFQEDAAVGGPGECRRFEQGGGDIGKGKGGWGGERAHYDAQVLARGVSVSNIGSLVV